MLNDYKTSMKIIMLSPRMKMQVGLNGLLFFVGLLFCFSSDGMEAVGAMYAFLPVATFVQLFYSSNEAGIVMSSPLKKKTQTYYPFLYAIPYAVIAYSLLITYHVYRALRGVGTIDYAMQNKFILGMSLMVICDFIYSVTCYKEFVGTTIAFIVIVAATCVFTQSKYIAIDLFSHASLYKVCVVGIISVIVGIIVSVSFSKIFYTKDIDKRATKGLIKK